MLLSVNDNQLNRHPHFPILQKMVFHHHGFFVLSDSSGSAPFSSKYFPWFKQHSHPVWTHVRNGPLPESSLCCTARLETWISNEADLKWSCLRGRVQVLSRCYISSRSQRGRNLGCSTSIFFGTYNARTIVSTTQQAPGPSGLCT